MVEQWNSVCNSVLEREPGLKPLWREVSNQCGSGADRIHWFRVDARPIRVKKYAVLKISGFVWK